MITLEFKFEMMSIFCNEKYFPELVFIKFIHNQYKYIIYTHRPLDNVFSFQISHDMGAMVKHLIQYKMNATIRFICRRGPVG